MNEKNLAPIKNTNNRLVLLAASLLLVVAAAFYFYSLNTSEPLSDSQPQSPGTGKPAGIASAKDTPPTSSAPAIPGNEPSPPPAASPSDVEVVTLPEPAPKPAPAAPKPTAPAIRITAHDNVATPAAALTSEPWKLREERRELSTSFFDIGTRVRNGDPPPSELEFPLFDGNTVTLTDFEFRPQALPNEGVFFAKVKNDPLGGHVIFSYVNNALAGSIHSPAVSAFYEIRNATPQGGATSQVFLTQFDPAKMPRCGTCQPVPKTGAAPTARAH